MWTSKGLGFRFLNEIWFMLPMTSLNLIGGLQDAFMEGLMCFGVGFCSIEDAHLGAPQEQEVHVWCASLILLVLHDVNSCQASLQIFICRDRLKQCFGYKSATILHGFWCCWTQKTWTWVDRSHWKLHHITECDAGFF